MGKEFTDTETGEVKREPEFVKLYIRNLCQVKGITGRQVDMFHFMLAHMNDYNEVIYGKPSKDRFMAEHGTTNATFNNNIGALIKRGLIKRIGKGLFKVNPKYVVKVDWARVQKITWVREFTEEGKSETVVWETESGQKIAQTTQEEPAPPPKPKPKKPSHTAEELEIFEYWKMRMGKSNNAKLNGKRLANLKARLKDGYGVEYIKKAIDGCASSPHHMGQNDQGTVYDDLELICRTSTKVENFAESVGKMPRKSNVKTIDDFMRENEASAARVLASGLLDDLP